MQIRIHCTLLFWILSVNAFLGMQRFGRVHSSPVLAYPSGKLTCGTESRTLCAFESIQTSFTSYKCRNSSLSSRQAQLDDVTTDRLPEQSERQPSAVHTVRANQKNIIWNFLGIPQDGKVCSVAHKNQSCTLQYPQVGYAEIPAYQIVFKSHKGTSQTSERQTNMRVAVGSPVTREQRRVVYQSAQPSIGASSLNFQP